MMEAGTQQDRYPQGGNVSDHEQRRLNQIEADLAFLADWLRTDATGFTPERQERLKAITERAAV